MAAATQSALLAIHDKEYAKLLKLLDQLDGASADWATHDDDTRIKDIIAHRTHWIRLFFGWYEGGKQGQDVQTPAPGYKWNQLKAYNAQVRSKHADDPWPDLRERFEHHANRLRDFIDSHDDAELYVRHLYPWMNDWTLGRWAEASGASAFRSAAKYIRKALREQA